MTIQLSKRAQKLLQRIRDGRFYMTGGRVPQCMSELERAGLVTVCMRPMVFVAAYVPTDGYAPYVPEHFDSLVIRPGYEGS